MTNETNETKNDYNNLTLNELSVLLNNRIKRNSGDALISAFGLKFLHEQKKLNLIAFPKEYLIEYFKDLTERKQQRIIKAILDSLIGKNLIAEKSDTKTIYRFREKPLKSFDFNSYALMMGHNGYKRHLYQYVKRAGCNLPMRKKVLSLKMNETIPEDEALYFDESDIKSNKSNIGVFSNGSKSKIREKWYNRKLLTYTIL